jgi:uncharacterized protein YbjT (DUF2867 family)
MPITGPGATVTHPNRTVAVYGGYGHTARFVLAELRRRGWTPIPSGRDPVALAGLASPDGAVWAGRDPEVRTATVDDPEALDRALAGAVAVVNCAGPFAETAPALIEAALRAGIHYLDLTGESLVAMTTFDTYADDPRVAAAGIVIAPALGFYGAVGELLATVAAGDPADTDPTAGMARATRATDTITVAVALDSWIPTRGTRLAGERRAGRRVVHTGGRLRVLPPDPPPPLATWDFAPPFGRQDVVGEFSTVDVVTISRHLAPARVEAYLNVAPLADLQASDGAGPRPADPSGRSAQTFLVEVVVQRGTDRRQASAAGRDIYAITAPIVVEALERILAGTTLTSGLATAGQLFDAADFLSALPLTWSVLPR